jgi:nitroimidazol reductase NimA-like FMN-containing flavoprotein (pyridoxamine 5'-phosphate oxidase superfamily)
MTTAKVGRPYIPDYGIPETLEGILSWDYVDRRMQEAINYWIATVDPEGRPHATPVWGVWLDGSLYFDGSPKTRRGRNLAANPNVTVHLEDGSKAVILQGEAREIKAPPLALRQKLSEAYARKYAGMGYEPGPETWESGGVYAVQVRQAFAWTDFPKDCTRWQFE